VGSAAAFGCEAGEPGRGSEEVKPRAALALVLALLPALAAAQMGAAPPPQPASPGVLQQVKFEERLGEAVPLDLAFTDETGRAVRLADYFGKRPVVLSLVYYDCPMLCTLSLNGLSAALEVLSFVPGQQFEVVTVSFDPKETPALAAAKKKAYLSRYKRPGAQAGWHFLTGSAESIAALTRAVGFRYVWDEATKQFAHPAGVVVLTPEAKISHYLFGVEYAPKDLRLALVAAGGGRIGGPADQLLLYCYRYDPQAGRFSASILNLVRVLGVLTVLGLAAFILSASVKRRPRDAHATTGDR
jgi:protein SCO1